MGINTHTHWMGMNIMGHFTSPPFSLSFSLAPSFHNLSLSSFFPPLSCSLNLSLSLCEGHAIDFPLSIHFSRLALKRGKQTKATTAPPLSLHPSPLLHPPPFSFPLCWPSPRPKTLGQGGEWRNATASSLRPPSSSSSSPLSSQSSASSFLSSFSLYSFYICPFPSSLPYTPFQLDLRPHSTNGIKVMHHT